MNFVELFGSTRGRVGRGLYWSCFGAWLVIDILLRASVNVVSAFTSNENIIAIPFWTWVLFGVASYFPMTALLVKRLHDTGRSGWWTAFQHLFMAGMFMLFISIARMAVGSMLLWFALLGVCALGMFVVFVFTLLDGDEGSSNPYGMAH